MPNNILELIKSNSPCAKIKKELTKQEKVPLFSKLQELNNKSLFDHLMLYEKVSQWTLAHFISNKAIDFTEVNQDGKNLIQVLLEKDDLLNFNHLLLAGHKPTETFYTESEGTRIGSFLRYRAGRENPTVYEISNQKNTSLTKLQDLAFDFADTSDEESSDAELTDTEELTVEENEAYQAQQKHVIDEYNATGEGEDSIRIMAARGVHFVGKHFPQPARQLVHDTKHEPHTTYGFSTLFDSGYEADVEPDEDDERIAEIHQRNLQFVETLKETPDKKEKKIGSRTPPKARNDKVFENLFWREIQVYINSYDTLFNLRGIKINFGFASGNNPHLSLSWKTEVGGMYGGGVRFGWKRGERRDPHYRRYDGKPKHPNVGYIDIFEFPIDYVRANGVDRLLAYNAGKISLSNIHLAEAEVIFHSMIGKTYHVRRHIIALPSFNKPVNTTDKSHFGMEGSGTYTRARNGLFAAIKNKNKGEDYQKWVTKRTEYAVDAQAKIIDKKSDLRLFKSGKVKAYDHGTTVSSKLPTPNH